MADKCLDITTCLTGFGCKFGVGGKDYVILKELLELSDYTTINENQKNQMIEIFKKHTCLSVLTNQTILHILARYFTDDIVQKINSWKDSLNLPGNIEVGMNNIVNFLDAECSKNTPFAQKLKSVITVQKILINPYKC